ncbi:GlcG/HbpS family heme-binding protein [Halothiobacillus sp.]|uniref:GlcG/HbpS family heme-binding protein n=1 Tax=Halothiobacillus sp. TaxID=1891311 RepID=UPI003A0FF6B7
MNIQKYMNKKTAIAVALGFGLNLAITTVQAADEPPVITIKRLSMEMALKAAEAAIHTCRGKGIQIGVTVVDRGGNPQVVLRDVLAPDLTLTISRMKAYTAISFTAPTSSLGDRGDSALGRVPGLFFGAGGVPIQAGGQTYGAIGVSGAPSGKTDEECARAGAKVIEDELELM